MAVNLLALKHLPKVRFLSGRYSFFFFLMHDIESFVNIGTAPIHCLQKNPKMMYLSLLCPNLGKITRKIHFAALIFWHLKWDRYHIFLCKFCSNYLLGKLNLFWELKEDCNFARLFKTKWRNTTRIFLGLKQEKISI